MLDVPSEFRRGALRGDQEKSIQSGADLIERIKLLTGKADPRPLHELRWLDYGCGVKLVQALLREKTRVREYVGLDIYKDMMEWLKANVRDERFQFVFADMYNEKYNTTGEPIDENLDLPLDGSFDLITMFSVVTHLNPADTLNILSSLRRRANPDAHLIFSAILNDEMAVDFEDAVPDQPMLWAIFKTGYLRSIVADAGWEIVDQYPMIPELIQNHFHCRPA